MITSIKRDFNLFPQIVGIVTTDNLATITTAGYWTTQLATVELLNNGVWQWEVEDICLIYYSNNQIGFFQFNPITNTFLGVGSTNTETFIMTPTLIEAMYATPVQLIAAPGVGNAIIIDSITWNFTFGTTQYTLGGATQAQYGATVHGAGTAASSSIAAATINAVAANTVITQTGVTLDTALSLLDNQAIYMSNASQAFATGDSVATLAIRYHIIPA